MVYMAYDGDNAGRLVGRSILADNPDALHEVSERIQLGHEVVRRWVESHGGQIVSGGGDEGIFSIPADAIHSVEELRNDYKFATNLTATVGIGQTLSEAGKAMLVGKFRGKNQVVQYEPSIEQEIKQAQNNVSQGTASAEEKKIDEAYLKSEGTVPMANENSSNDNIPAQDDCPYCAETGAQNIEDTDHCKYCHDMDAESDCPYCHDTAADGHLDDCPLCAEHDAAADGHDDNCPLCAQMDSQSAPAAGDDEVVPTAGPTVNNPTTTDSENYAGQDLNQPDLPKPDAIQQVPDGQGVSLDTPTNENVKLDVAGQGAHNEEVSQENQGVDPQSEQTIEQIAQEIEEEPTNSPQEAAPVEYVDSADKATGTRMQGNVSRPENYDEQNRPQDMGLGEEESTPDITGVMQEGLDSHADNIQREKVVNLVGEALAGFKACKGILEKSKLQAPQLYESSIAMLKAMIEMCKMLGLDQDAETGDGQDPLGDASQPAAEGTPEYEQAGPPGNGAKEGAAGNAAAGSPEYEKASDKGDGDANLPKQKGQLANQ